MFPSNSHHIHTYYVVNPDEAPLLFAAGTKNNMSLPPFAGPNRYSAALDSVPLLQ
jgi:hypothetical protein